ncbi:uncharacterized protein [Macrobrachium rosenbergii]|uniref:uncharacterized protein n=1 Tax=Macrobrachium rosenbergii TaxID=79674 RepID=UPI0034D50FBC
MEEALTASCAETLLSSWISRFRVPDSITTERGSAFLSELWVSLARLMGTTLHSTTAYNPTAKFMVERAHRSLKAALMARCTDENWRAQLPWVLPGLRTAPRADSTVSPAEKVYGETLAVPGEFLPSSADSTDTRLQRLRDLAQKFVPCHKTFMDRTNTYSPAGLDSCTYFFIRIDACRPPLTRPYRGPYRVIDRTPKAYLIDVHSREDWVSIDRLKSALLLDSEIREEAGRRSRVTPQNTPADITAAPPRRGRGNPRGRAAADPAVDVAPRPQFLKRRGRLLLPQHLSD